MNRQGARRDAEASEGRQVLSSPKRALPWWHQEPLKSVDLDICLSGRQRDYLYRCLKCAYTDADGNRVVKLAPDAVRQLLAICDVHETTRRLDMLALIDAVRGLLLDWGRLMKLKRTELKAELPKHRRELSAAMAAHKGKQ